MELLRRLAIRNQFAWFPLIPHQPHISSMFATQTSQVRDPVERVISWYYYVRAPWYYVERKRAFPDLPLPDPAWLKKDFETCVLSGDRECRYQEGETHEGIGDHRRQTLFFCGHEPQCTPFNSNEALQRAKRVVEQQYAVVGRN
ncbi:unnamed protein product [Leptidea sinapis]|uniref:Uncharacterized protein n=1 Tax=Leptidea sinapis TaxID=189913 RepID=A0A5E4QY97_9NEOP|nr:unnamed protein product [Leptidea sinapis]